MKRKMLAMIVVLTMIVGMVTGCSSAGSGNTVKIAFAGPLTGDMSVDGIDARNGAKLAVEKINEEGGINGKTVELVEYDDKGDTKEAATVASRISQDKDTYAVIGHYNSGCSLAATPIYEKAHIISIAFASSANSLSDAGDYIFRTCNSDDVSAEKCAEIAVKQLGHKKLAIMYEDDDYGKGLADSFEKYTKESGGEVVSVNAYMLGETKDFTSILTKINQTEADMIFIAGLYTEAAMIVKQERQVGLDIPCMGSEALFSVGLIDLGGESVEGFYATAGFSTESKEDYIQEFIADFTKEFGEAPGTTAACAYDGVMAAVEAMKGCGENLTRENVKDQMYQVDINGISGQISFDENGDCHKDYLVVKVTDGVFKLAE